GIKRRAPWSRDRSRAAAAGTRYPRRCARRPAGPAGRAARLRDDPVSLRLPALAEPDRRPGRRGRRLRWTAELLRAGAERPLLASRRQYPALRRRDDRPQARAGPGDGARAGAGVLWPGRRFHPPAPSLALSRGPLDDGALLAPEPAGPERERTHPAPCP